MPFEQALPNPTAIYDEQLTWPGPNRTTNPGGGMLDWAYLTTFRGESQSLTRFRDAGASSGVTSSANMGVFKGMYCFEVTRTGAGQSRNNLGGWPMPIKQTSADLAGGVALPSSTRVFWLRWLMFLNPDTTSSGNTGMACVPRGNSANTNRWPPTNLNAGFGFFGSVTASGVAWASFDNTGATIETVDAGVADATDWNLYELVIINSGPGRNATVEALANGVSLVTRTFTGGTNPLAQYTGTDFLYDMLWGEGDLGQTALTGVELRAGRFDRDGVEILA